jgi:hypothetical protein
VKRVTSYTSANGDVRTHVDIGATRYGSKQRRKRSNKRLLATLLAVVVAVMVAIAIAATATAQEPVVCMSNCQPWQEVGDAPALLKHVSYLPIVEK